MSRHPYDLEFRVCVHCGYEYLGKEGFGTHAAGPATGLMSCGTVDGSPYGYRAHDKGVRPSHCICSKERGDR